MDDLDRAQVREELDRELALAAQRGRTAPLFTPGIHTVTHCCDCGSEIPEARRQAVPGTLLCVDCQAIFEQQQRRGAHD